MIPYFKSTELIVVTGELAYTAIDALRGDAATGGIRCTLFNDCVFIHPYNFAQVMRETAREIHEPSIVRPLPRRASAMIRLADLHVIAPADTDERVWLIPRDGHAFSLTLVGGHDPVKFAALPMSQTLKWWGALH